ncbi:MAG: adenylyl-sulfate kinase, partial [Flavobacteriaceae bacterium]|nr:adenylyl-sulfate kinase [Flavobacteriaceae bacterium]
MNKNIVPQTYSVTREDRSRLLGHEPLLLWFTGLSGSGKSTIANGVERALHRENVKTYVLDGDNVRGGINNDLSFSSEDRTENIRRIAEVSKLMLDAGLVVLATFVSPYRNDRDAVKQAVGYTNMVEIFVNTPIAECERRDVKGLYARARAGEISNFTGIDAPYEAPVAADIQINTVEM